MPIKPRIAIIIGSTRPTRFADRPAQWMLKQAQARDDMEVELIDLRDHPLPFFDEGASNLWMPSKNPEAIRWQQTVARFDGFVFVVAEYNHSVTAALKNALDEAYNEWVHKPFAAIGYGGVGAARAIEHLRAIGVELQMVPGPHERQHRRPGLYGGRPPPSATSRSRRSRIISSPPPSPCWTSWSGGRRRPWRRKTPTKPAGEQPPRVLLIGVKPEAVDYADPDLPPGLDEAKVAAGIEATLADMRGRGWEAVFCPIAADGDVEAAIAEALRQSWDCVVIGAGVRAPAANLLLFERVVNAVRGGAPGTPVAFNKEPTDSAGRGLPGGSIARRG